MVAEAPYKDARRVFWIMDNGSSHRGERSIERLTRGLSTIGARAWARARELAQSNRDLLLDLAAQSAHPKRLPELGGGGAASVRIRAI